MSHHREKAGKIQKCQRHHHMFHIEEKEEELIRKAQQKDRKNNYIMSKVTVIMKMNINHRSRNNA